MHAVHVRFVAFLALVTCTLWGCSPSVVEQIVLEVGDEKIFLSEYEQFYERNLGGRDAARQSSLEERENFLDLLTNYKLKLRDAYARNLLNEQDVQEELGDYRTRVATTFLIDREVTEPSLRTMYQRRKEELRGSHILLRLDQNASPQETLKVWNRAMDIIKQLDSGRDFAAVAVEHSEDQTVNRNRGDLYYFTSGNMVAAFEDAAFSLRVGEYTKRPVRTVFGYHIIKLTDRKPSIHSINASHIMIAFKPTAGDTTAPDSAFVKIRAIYDSIKAGHDFATLAKQYSEDPGSAPRGGSLGYFSRRRFVQEFEEFAFKLKPGEISDVVKTTFGYHIIKCDDVRSLPSFEEMRGDLHRLYQGYRYNEDYARYLDRQKEQVGFSKNEQALKELFAHLDSTKLPHDSLWADKVPGNLRQNVALTIGRRSFTVDSLITIFSTGNEYKDSPVTSTSFPTQLARIADYLVLEAASVGLEQRDPDFKRLMKEFRDGVVLYKAEQLEVWNKIEMDEEKLRSFYGERKHQYPLPDRVEFIEVSTDSQRLAARFVNDLKRGRKLDTLVARSKGKLRRTSRGLVPADTDTLAQIAWANAIGSVLGPIRHNGRYVVVQVTMKDPARYKTFEEVAAELSTAFQDHEAKRLEREWLDRLRKQYPVVQHRDLLENAFAREQPAL